MRWVPAALLVVLTATACGGGDAEPAAIATPTSTPTQSDAVSPRKGPPEPATTRSPGANVLFEWAPFVDEASGSSVALPKGAEPIANTIPGPDGGTVTTRGHVFEHAAGVIGSELIDDYASLDDLQKLAELLADSVGGAVLETADVDTGRARGLDGEIGYGTDQLMLFRILVLNSDGDVWNGFAGGPETDRERLESEFARLTLSADFRPSVDWVAVTDEPSGLAVDLPEGVAPSEYSEELDDGGTWSERGYHHDSGAGFVVSDALYETIDLVAVLDGHADSIDGTVESTEHTEALGRAALDGVVLGGDWRYAYRIVQIEEWVLVLYFIGAADEVEESRQHLDRMTESVSFREKEGTNRPIRSSQGCGSTGSWPPCAGGHGR
jgi:hypothetical protein